MRAARTASWLRDCFAPSRRAHLLPGSTATQQKAGRPCCEWRWRLQCNQRPISRSRNAAPHETDPVKSTRQSTNQKGLFFEDPLDKLAKTILNSNR